MRDEWAADRFEVDLRDALHLELAGVRVGVAAPQVRGRIASRERARRTTRLVLLAAGLAAVLLGGLVLAGRFLPAPPPGAAEPATIAAIDAATGDLVLARAWPDGRTEEAARYPGALDLLRGVIGLTNAIRLPDDAVVTAGTDGGLAILLPGGAVITWPGPARAGQIADSFTTGWVGWSADGRLARVGGAYARLLDPVTGIETAVALPPDVHPDWMTGEDQLMAWTDDGKIVAERSDPASFASEVGVLDVAGASPTFVPGLPTSVRADTGREQRYAADGSWPGSGCQDDRLLSRCAGVASWWSMQSDLPTSTWYVTRSDEGLHPVPARTADGAGLLLVTRSTTVDEGRVIIATAPGSWREAFTFVGPRIDTGSLETMVAGWSTIVGVAPGGRTIALRTPAGLVIGDLSTGATATLAGGTVFVGWPAAPVVATERRAGLPACTPATPDDAAGVAITAAGITSPASAGARPVLGERQDADPFRRDALASALAVEAEVDGILALALPAGTCAEAASSSAVPVAGAADDPPVELGTWTAGAGTVTGLLPVVAPPPGDWVVRVTLWLDGADREAILLYRVTVPEPADANGEGMGASPSPEP